MASQAPLAPREQHAQLIVIFKDPTKVESTPQATESLASPSADASSAADVSSTIEVAAETDSPSLQNILDRHDASLRLMFGATTERVQNDQAHFSVMAAMSGTSQEDSQAPKADDLPDLSLFHQVDAHPEKLEQLQSELLAHDDVDAAYITPPVLPPRVSVPVPTKAKPPSTTPNFITNQIYLNAAPAGIDAIYASTEFELKGGLGDGVSVIDCEHGWHFTHEDLRVNKGGIVVGTGSNDEKHTSHGTGVAGIISGDKNAFGVTGIAPNATFSGASWAAKAGRSYPNTATIINDACAKLAPGDILLLEGQLDGDLWKEASESDVGLIPMEWWPHNLAAIQKAVAKGIIVVEAAGNGYQNLDDPMYELNRGENRDFGTSWKNPFNPKNPSSGAIMVGAGNPPPGTHGRDHGPDRSICDYSNYGSRVDCQGWGMEVTTTGGGDLQGGTSDIMYTDTFNGTSSASPVVVGALAVLQGILKAYKKPLLTPGRAVKLLRDTGSPQEDDPNRPKTRRIGNRPDLRKLIPLALGK